MLKVLSIVCPPLAVLRAGSTIQAVVALPLTAMLYLPGVIYAWNVVSRYEIDRRNQALLNAVRMFDSAA
jgi:uncharacterized membrane protein YqaE (UPF0057 family)